AVAGERVRYGLDDHRAEVERGSGELAETGYAGEHADALTDESDSGSRERERVARLECLHDLSGALQGEREALDDLLGVTAGFGYLRDAVDDLGEAGGDVVTRRAAELGELVRER